MTLGEAIAPRMIRRRQGVPARTAPLRRVERALANGDAHGVPGAIRAVFMQEFEAASARGFLG